MKTIFFCSLSATTRSRLNFSLVGVFTGDDPGSGGDRVKVTDGGVSAPSNNMAATSATGRPAVV